MFDACYLCTGECRTCMPCEALSFHVSAIELGISIDVLLFVLYLSQFYLFLLFNILKLPEEICSSGNVLNCSFSSLFSTFSHTITYLNVYLIMLMLYIVMYLNVM